LRLKIDEDQLTRRLAHLEAEHCARLAGHTDAIAKSRIAAANIASCHAALKNCGNWSLELADSSWDLVEGIVEEAPPRRVLEDGFLEFIPWVRSGVNGMSSI
jgi:hypothetical protein